MIHVLLQELVNLVIDISSIMHNRKVSLITKLALLVTLKVLQPVVQLVQERLVTPALHQQLFLHNLKDRLLCSRLQHINASLIIRELNVCNCLSWQFTRVQLSRLLEDVHVKLLLKLLIGIIDAQLLKRVVFLECFKTKDVQKAD